MNDLSGSRNVPFSPPDIDEAVCREVVEALKSGWITTGPRTKELERRIAAESGAAGCACLNSATAALELTLRILRIGPGDEVIVPAYTYTASASPVLHVGATPVFVDANPGDFEIDLEAVAEAITPRTKAVIPVDIGGKMCDYPALFRLLEKKREVFEPANELQGDFGRIIVIADGAHSFGASRDGASSGSAADFTTFSFHAVKNLTTAEGGAAVWRERDFLDSEEIYNQYMLLSLHGQSKDALAKTGLGAWEYDIVSPAYKCNMTDVAAAIGLAQMRRYDSMLARRRELIERYDRALLPAGVESLDHFSEGSISSGHLYLVRVPGISLEERNEIIHRMAQLGIACNVHYKPLPLMTAYRDLGFRPEDFPEAIAKYSNLISLPLHTRLEDEDVDYVSDALIGILEEIRA